MLKSSPFPAAGYLRFPTDESLLAWARHARPFAEAAAKDETLAHWLRCAGTWFVGVDALPNDSEGRVNSGPPLAGAAIDLIRKTPGLWLPLHRAQISVCYPDYPQPSPDETDTAYRFRLKRDAAHVDGLLAEGPDRRRYLREPHAYILGIGLTAQSPNAAPLTVWEGSHVIMGEMFAKVFAGHPPAVWREIDVTGPYQAARREVFDSCRRVEIPTGPGEAVLLHRHLLHGVAPWGEEATGEAPGRMIAYFRPEFTDVSDWLDQAPPGAR